MRSRAGERQSIRGDGAPHLGRAGSRGADRWAIILAGGDGTRLRPLTRAIAGDERPKQFCAVLGSETLLDQTRSRVALSVAPARTLFVLTRAHEPFYDPLLGGAAREQLVVQPRNAGTAPAILYSLLRLSKSSPSSAVALFPSDHFFSDDAAFMSHVDTAFEAARDREDLIVLLGIEPEGPEGEYGWIEPAAPVSAEGPDSLRGVRRFWEKPTREFAGRLLERGCLWNSFVMVGRVAAFLRMISSTVPEIYRQIDADLPAISTPQEERAVGALYSLLLDTNFSHRVLAASPQSLAVLRVGGVSWSDLGKPGRVMSVMAEVGLGPAGRGGGAAAAAPKVVAG